MERVGVAERTRAPKKSEETEKRNAVTEGQPEVAPELLGIRFSQDQESFVAGTSDGFGVYTASNVKNQFFRGG